MKILPKQPETKPVLVAIHVKEISTNTILLSFPPTKVGERNANRYLGLADLETIKEYKNTVQEVE